LGVEYLNAGGQSAALNLGSGEGISVMDVLKAVEKVSGKPVPHELFERRAGDPPHLVAKSDLARQVLGWKPERSDIETIVRDAWGWSEKAIGEGLYSE
jgi:UDP-glucose 4-epimerase